MNRLRRLNADTLFTAFFVVILLFAIISGVHNLRENHRCHERGGSYVQAPYNLPWGFSCIERGER